MDEHIDAIISAESDEIAVGSGMSADLSGRSRGLSKAHIVGIVLLVALALTSVFPLRETFTNPATYEAQIQTLDEKKGNVTALVAMSTAASAGISLIPDDVGTPIANKLMDLSSNLMVILAVIYLEKYLITIFGMATFAILVPVACVLGIAAIVLWNRAAISRAAVRLAMKLVVLGAVLMFTVPTSVAVTNMIDETYDITASIQEANQAAAEEEDTDEAPSDPLSFIASIPNMVADGLASVSNEMLDEVNSLIESAAVMIVTSCVIPIVVLVFYLWIANMLLGIDVSTPKNFLSGRMARMGGGREAVAESGQRVREARAGCREKTEMQDAR